MDDFEWLRERVLALEAALARATSVEEQLLVRVAALEAKLLDFDDDASTEDLDGDYIDEEALSD